MLDALHFQFLGTDELRKKLTALLKNLSKKEDIVVTQKGEPVAVLVDMDRYLEEKQALQELSDPIYLKELLEAKLEIRKGKGMPADKLFKKRRI
ncbi:MAG: type II toxin-antitoxin system prevent-host-death family antitoxin [Armatimonadota bacterium]